MQRLLSLLLLIGLVFTTYELKDFEFKSTNVAPWGFSFNSKSPWWEWTVMTVKKGEQYQANKLGLKEGLRLKAVNGVEINAYTYEHIKLQLTSKDSKIRGESYMITMLDSNPTYGTTKEQEDIEEAIRLSLEGNKGNSHNTDKLVEEKEEEDDDEFAAALALSLEEDNKNEADTRKCNNVDKIVEENEEKKVNKVDKIVCENKNDAVGDTIQGDAVADTILQYVGVDQMKESSQIHVPTLTQQHGLNLINDMLNQAYANDMNNANWKEGYVDKEQNDLGLEEAILLSLKCNNEADIGKYSKICDNAMSEGNLNESRSSKDMKKDDDLIDMAKDGDLIDNAFEGFKNNNVKTNFDPKKQAYLLQEVEKGTLEFKQELENLRKKELGKEELQNPQVEDDNIRKKE